MLLKCCCIGDATGHEAALRSPKSRSEASCRHRFDGSAPSKDRAIRPRLTQKASTGLPIPPDARACGFLLVEDVALTVRRAAARSFRTLYTVRVEPWLGRLFGIFTARVRAIFDVRSAGFRAEILGRVSLSGGDGNQDCNWRERAQDKSRGSD